MASTFPHIIVPRTASEIPRDYDGFVFISDIDKTYLATQIDSLGGLLKAAFEAAERKANIPGFSIILRAVRRGGLEEAQRNPLFFVSASPPQMAGKLERKMGMDGVQHDGIIFKNQLENVRRAEFKKLKEQIGYKLAALLCLWKELPQKSKLVMFGDDSESDAVIYSLFAEILAGHISSKDLHDLLLHLKVSREDAVKISWFVRSFSEPVFPVRAVFINLETGSQGSYYSRFGPFVYASENALQIALTLFEQKLIREQAVRSVGRDLLIKHGLSQEDIRESLESGARRGLYGVETLDHLWSVLFHHGILPEPAYRFSQEGAVSRFNSLQRWQDEGKRFDLRAFKKRYSEEGRY